MIVGLGTDLCQIERIENTIARFGLRFQNRIFTPREWAQISRKPEKTARRAAMAFAAKEACSKALGTGLRQGVFWRDMELLHEPSGKPSIILHGNAQKRAQFLCGGDYNIVVSLTDEAGLANAVVILEKI